MNQLSDSTSMTTDRARTPRIVASVTIVILFVGLIGMGWFAGVTYWSKIEMDRDFKQTTLEREAERKERVKLTQQYQEARDARADAESVADFTLSLFSAGGKDASKGEDRTVSDVLQEAVRRLDDREFTCRPTSEIELRRKIGRAFEALGRLDSAETQFRKVLSVTDELHEDDHPAMIESMQDLAAVLIVKGETTEGNQLQSKAVALYDLRAKDIPWGRVPRLYGIAQRMIESGEPFRAVGHMDYAIAVIDRQYGPHHPLIYRAMLRKAGVLNEAEQLVESENVYRQVIDHLRQCLPASHLHIADALTGYIALLIKTRRFDEAEALARECLAIREQSLPSDDWRRASAQCLLGEVLFSKGAFEDAEPLLTNGLRALTELPNAPKERQVAVVDCVVRFYKAWNKPERAEEIQRLAGTKRRQRPESVGPGLSIE